MLKHKCEFQYIMICSRSVVSQHFQMELWKYLFAFRCTSCRCLLGTSHGTAPRGAETPPRGICYNFMSVSMAYAQPLVSTQRRWRCAETAKKLYWVVNNLTYCQIRRLTCLLYSCRAVPLVPTCCACYLHLPELLAAHDPQPPSGRSPWTASGWALAKWEAGKAWGYANSLLLMAPEFQPSPFINRWRKKKEKKTNKTTVILFFFYTK